MRDGDGVSLRGNPSENAARHHASKAEHADGDRIHTVKIEQQPAVEPFLRQRLLDPGQCVGREQGYPLALVCPALSSLMSPGLSTGRHSARHSQLPSPRALHRVCSTAPWLPMSSRSSSRSVDS